MLTSWRHWHLVLEICDLYNYLRSKKVFRMKSVYKKTFDFIPHMTYFHWFHMLTSWGPWNLDWGFIMKWASDCNVLWFETRVSSEKEKSFRENFPFFVNIFISRLFRFVFAFRSLAKNAKTFTLFAKFCDKIMQKCSQKI